MFEVLSRFLISWFATLCSIDPKSTKFRSLATCPMIQWSKFDLDSMVTIESRFPHSCCIGFFASPCRDSRNFDMELDQWSRSDLYSTAAIESQFRISRNRHSCCIVSLTSPTRDPRNPNIDWNQRSRSNLDLTAQITSRFCISQLRPLLLIP